jgi:hypothetical protein
LEPDEDGVGLHTTGFLLWQETESCKMRRSRELWIGAGHEDGDWMLKKATSLALGA